VGNVVGSNIFNLLAVLGVSALVAPDGVGVTRAVATFDLPVMTAVAFACLPVFLTGHVISRWEGALFLGYYAAYVTYLVIHAVDHPLLPEFRTAMAVFVIPLTVLTLVLAGLRLRTRR
jgi:cation:H+ antiporter